MAFGAPFPGTALVVMFLGASQNPAGNGAHSGVNFGPATPGRYILVALSSYEPMGASASVSVTIGGVVATQIAMAPQNAITIETSASLWLALVPTGTSGTVQVSASSLGINAISVYSLVGLFSPTPDATAIQGSGSNNLSQNIAVKAGGVVFAAAVANGTSGNTSWSGVSADGNFGSIGNLIESQAHAALLPAQTLTVAASIPGGLRGWALAVASFH